MTGIECMLIRRQLKWVGHITRMDNRRLPKQVLFGQLLNAPRKPGGQKLRYCSSSFTECVHSSRQLGSAGIRSFNVEGKDKIRSKKL